MKVLVTIPCLLTGGTEIQTLNLVHALVEGGHEVTTACFFEHSDYMVEQYEKAGSRVVLFSEGGTRIGGLACVWFLFKHLWTLKRKFQPDAVHVQYMAPGAIPILLLWLMGQKNILATTHTPADIYSSFGLRMIHFLQEHVLRAFQCITELAEKSYFGNSTIFEENTERVFQKNGKISKHTHFTIYNSLPYGMKFAEKRKPLQDGDIITIGVVSRLEHIKGMDFVIPAFKKVAEKHFNVRLLVVGEGSLRESMENSLTPTLSPLIQFVGRKAQEELYKWYGQMDIVLMPSRSEGFGLTAIEAMANGCVMVASNTGGLPEVVENGEVGLIHNPESIDDIVEKISILLNDIDLINRMRSNATEYVKRFSFESYSKLISDLYNKL